MDSPSALEPRASVSTNRSDVEKDEEAVTTTAETAAGGVSTHFEDNSISEKRSVPKNPRDCLAELPDELLVGICRIFLYRPYPDRGDQASLARLCGVNKRFRNIATEVLYDSPIGDALLLHTLWKNPLLAKHVRCLCTRLTNVWLDDEPDTPDHASLAIARGRYGRALRNLYHVELLSIQDGVLQNADDALDDEFHWTQVLKDGLSTRSKEWPNQFAHLKTLTLHVPHIPVEEYTCIFRIPSLLCLGLRECYQPTPFGNWDIPKLSCNIQNCDLGFSFMDTDAVAQILSTMNNLRIFRYRLMTHYKGPNGSKYRSFPHTPWPSHSWVKMKAALMQHKYTLERLCLGEILNPGVMAEACPDGIDAGTLGSFRDFPELKALVTQFNFDTFLGDDEFDLNLVAPPSLTDLVIYMPPDVAQLSRYAAFIDSMRDVYVPGRENLLILTFDEDFPFEKSHLYEPLKALEDMGVMIEVRSDRFENQECPLPELRELESAGVEGERGEQSIETSSAEEI